MNIVQPPDIGMPLIADIDADQTVVAVALAAKSSTETAKKAHSEWMRLITGLSVVSMTLTAQRLLYSS